MFIKSGIRLCQFISKNKRVINIPKARLESVEEAENKQQPVENSFVDVKKQDGKELNCIQLSSLSETQLSQIKYSVNKFKNSNIAANKLSEQETQKLQDKLNVTYQYLNNQRSHPELPIGQTVEMFDLHLEMSNQYLVYLIEHVFTNIYLPTQLYGRLQTSFIRYLVGFKNDLTRIKKHLTPEQVKIQSLKPIDINYEFCVDVNRNRNKNSNIEDYAITQQIIQNPNESLLMKQHHGKDIKIKHVIKRRRQENCKTVLRVNTLLEIIFYGGNRHYVKVQLQGPSIKGQNMQYPQTPAYQIIDIDGIMKGNPSIKLPFNFE